MLVRINLLKGVGIFHDTAAYSCEFKKITLIYAGNGRGKTTFTSMLRSVATGSNSIILERKTVDGKHMPHVILQFENGKKVTFENDAWSNKYADFLVFDSSFIEKNVHAGGYVNTDHRKNLLEFALGEKAVTAKKLAELKTATAKEATNKEEQIIKEISGYHQGISLKTFVELLPVTEPNIKIEALQNKIAAAEDMQKIIKAPSPNIIEEPTFDIDALFMLLKKSLENIQEDAEKAVKLHISNLNQPGLEAWLSQGQSFSDGLHCPYCAQTTNGHDLIQAYQAYFNESYINLKKQVGKLKGEISIRTDQNIIENFNEKVLASNDIFNFWNKHVKVEQVNFNKEEALIILSELKVLLKNLASKKTFDPTKAIGTEAEKIKSKDLWIKVLSFMQKSNQIINENKLKINSFCTDLKTENISNLRLELRNLQLAKIKESPVVRGLLENLKEAQITSRKAEQEKIKSRQELDNLMSKTLSQYKDEINLLLKNFGASFLIKDLGANQGERI